MSFIMGCRPRPLLLADTQDAHFAAALASPPSNLDLLRPPLASAPCSSASSVPLRFKGFAFLSRRENSVLAFTL